MRISNAHFQRFTQARVMCLAMLLSLAVLPVAVNAQGSNPSVTVNTIQQMNFGKFVKPTGVGRVDLDKDGILTANNIQLLSSHGTGAITTINFRRSKGNVYISLSNDGNVNGLNFRRFFGIYQCSGSGCSTSGNFNGREGRDFRFEVPSNGNVTLQLYYGARLRVRNNVAIGVHQPSYTVSIDHE